MTKPKTKGISPNKIGDKEHRRAETIQKKLQDQGIGRDEAWHRAIEMAVEEIHGGEGGGGNAGGGAKHQTGETSDQTGETDQSEHPIDSGD